jgi:hypothetical protein
MPRAAGAEALAQGAAEGIASSEPNASGRTRWACVRPNDCERPLVRADDGPAPSEPLSFIWICFFAGAFGDATSSLCLAPFRLAALPVAISFRCSLNVMFDIVGMIKALGAAVKDAVAQALATYK